MLTQFLTQDNSTMSEKLSEHALGHAVKWSRSSVGTFGSCSWEGLLAQGTQQPPAP